MPVPIIDIFAGPGGLGEGFSSLKDQSKNPFFEIVLSIEKDPVAHRTLQLRSVFRQLRGTHAVSYYYRYIRGEISETYFRSIPAVAFAYLKAEKEARCLELGKVDENNIDREIRAALNGQESWVLIGGPPCQAYSVAGRSRRARDKDFYKDEKHFLYKEYLRIIQAHRPTIFVMENVKGLLSSKHSGNSIFKRIINDLSCPEDGLEYEIRSFTKRGDSGSLAPTDFLIHSERYGIPQNRHRVVLLGVRKDSSIPEHQLMTPSTKYISVRDAIDDLPCIRSRLSRGDSPDAWRKAVHLGPTYLTGWRPDAEDCMSKAMHGYAAMANHTSTGGAFIPLKPKASQTNTALHRWLHDKGLGGVAQHESRAHMASDIARYLFLSCFAQLYGYSPRLDEFPARLLPEHLNVSCTSQASGIPFNDRFRVQCGNGPASTVVAHIAKDGHYYVHYDPTQCRSLTVREAARLQTFPDNYFFAGNRTEQYTQVGNAVPPLLAHKLAKIVRSLLNEMSRNKSRLVSHGKHNKPREWSQQGSPNRIQVPLLAETD